jgi:hypothetical protein
MDLYIYIYQILKGISVTSHVVPQLVVCDSEFFHRYDEFAEAASYKASSESVWRELKFKREKVINDRIILEKKRRVFYGTSQPHPVGVNTLVLWNDSTPTPALAARGVRRKDGWS